MSSVYGITETDLPINYNIVKFFEVIQNQTTDEIIKCMLLGFLRLPVSDRIFLEDYYNKYKFWGSLNLTTGDYTILKNRTEVLKNHSEDFLWLYHRLNDFRSKHILFSILKNWYTFESLENIKEKIYFDYFDQDIMKCTKDEVIVDIGAFTGDTILKYIKAYGNNYKKIFCYEITAEIYEALLKNLSSFSNIDFRRKGVADKKGLLYLNEHMDSSANLLSKDGNIAVETVTIDEDIKEPITFLKMDIEGFEEKALHGCKGHILEDKPKLAISVYHNNHDLWKIPQLIDEICKGYKFYLRYHGGRLSMSEVSLLAVNE